MKKEEKKALIAQMEAELSKVCGTYENDCSKCPKQALCNKYIAVSTAENGDFKRHSHNRLFVFDTARQILSN